MKAWLQRLFHQHDWVTIEEGKRVFIEPSGVEHPIGSWKDCRCSVCGKWTRFKL